MIRTARVLLVLAAGLLCVDTALAQQKAVPLPHPAPAATVAAAPAPAPAPAAKPTEVTISAPAATTTINAGTWIGEFLQWASLVFGAPLAALLTKLVWDVAQKMKIDLSDAARQRLQEMVEHGIALAAQKAQADLKDKLPIDVKSQVAVDALQYVHDHGVETLKALGVDPNDPQAIEAVQARIAKAMNDKVPPPAAA